MNQHPPHPGRLWKKRVLAVALGLVTGLVLVELGLMATGQPRFPRPVIKSPQFDLPEGDTADTFVDGGPLYRNSLNGKIRFVYHDNPRGYFGSENEVVHYTNSLGFRGPEFPQGKGKDELRVLFLGDSFTFGEGVWFDHTYAELSVKRLAESNGKNARIVSLNLGVSGYNTVQSAALLRRVGWPLKPDAVVLGFVLNDPEPVLFVKPRFADRITRRARRMEGWFSDPMPPRSMWFRISQLIWRFQAHRTRTARTVQHYRDLFQDTSPHWQRCQQALRQLVAACKKRNVPVCVVVFPVLYRLEDYPFEDVHQKLTRVIGKERTIDLLDRLRGRKAADLWVHTTDQHPNERVHRLAAELVAGHLSGKGKFK